MRILIVNLYGVALYCADHSQVHGGAEVDAWMIGKMAHEAGHEVHVLVDHCQCKTPSEVEDGFHLHSLVRETAVDTSMPLRLLAFWKALHRIRPDCCLIKLISPYSATLAAYCRLHHTGMIYRAGNLRDQRLAEGDRSYGWKEALYFRLTLSGLGVYLAQTAEQCEAIRTYHPCVKHCYRQVTTHTAKEGQPLSFVDRKHVLWVGHLSQVKRPDRLLELARLLPDRDFVMIASTRQGSEVQGIRAQIETQSNVRLIENVPLRDIQTWFDRAILFVNTSDSEGFPNTFIQASMAGTPLASLRVDPEGVVSRSGGGLLEPDARTLAQQIEELHKSPDRWCSMSTAVQVAMQSYYDWPAACQAYEKYFRIASGDLHV